MILYVVPSIRTKNNFNFSLPFDCYRLCYFLFLYYYLLHETKDEKKYTYSID